MKTQSHNGNFITVTATKTTLSGELVNVGVICGLATIDAAIGEEFEMAITGAYLVPVKSGVTIEAGEQLYLSVDDSAVTNVATDNVACGVAETGGDTEVFMVLR